MFNHEIPYLYDSYSEDFLSLHEDIYPFSINANTSTSYLRTCGNILSLSTGYPVPHICKIVWVSASARNTPSDVILDIEASGVSVWTGDWDSQFAAWSVDVDMIQGDELAVRVNQGPGWPGTAADRPSVLIGVRWRL
jgi:hypothetical protein